MTKTMQPFYRDTWVEINLDDIQYNIGKTIELLPKETTVFAVVKANAYGHGAVQVAKAALAAGAKRLAVAFLDEALNLRHQGITAPILILGSTRAEDVKIAAEAGIALTVHSLEWLERAFKVLETEKACPVLSIHLKCDTGMGRLGFRTHSELKAAEEKVRGKEGIVIEGIFTHFATADEQDTALTKKQLERFNGLIGCLEELPPLIHSSNSAATLLYPDAHFNAVRTGISMYGLSPSPEIKSMLPFPLKEAFSLFTRVKQVKQINPGDPVSYGATYVAEESEWIATLPIGYADGWIRKLSGQTVLVNGKRVPIIGRVCMDQCMVKLNEPVAEGELVTLIGKNDGAIISVDEIAEKLETINYEVVCQITSRVPRVYLQNGEVTEVINPLMHE